MFQVSFPALIFGASNISNWSRSISFLSSLRCCQRQQRQQRQRRRQSGCCRLQPTMSYFASTHFLTSDSRDSWTSLSDVPGCASETCDAFRGSSTSTCVARDGLCAHATSNDGCERRGTCSRCDVAHGSDFAADLCSCCGDARGFDCATTSGVTLHGLCFATGDVSLDFRRDVDVRRPNLCCRAFASCRPPPPLAAFVGLPPPSLSPPSPSSSPPRLCRWRPEASRSPCAACPAGGRRFVAERRRRSKKLRRSHRPPWLSAERCTRL